MGLTMRCCGEATTIKSKYEEETKYKDDMQFTVYRKLELVH